MGLGGQNFTLRPGAERGGQYYFGVLRRWGQFVLMKVLQLRESSFDTSVLGLVTAHVLVLTVRLVYP